MRHPIPLGVVLSIGTLSIALAHPAASAPRTPIPSDQVAVTQVLVNKAGAVSVRGTVSCGATGAAIKAGTSYIGTELQPFGEGQPISLAQDDVITLLVSSDNYTVSQVAGRKYTISVTHESSRLNPCYTENALGPSGETMLCQPGDTSCPWATDKYGWDSAMQGPLFDIPLSGKFVTGTVTVDGVARDLGIIVQREGHWYWTLIEGGLFMPYQRVLKAVAYRG